MEGLNGKLIKVMQGLENPKKSKDGYNYKYETLEQVLSIVKTALEAEGLALMQGVEWNPDINTFVLVTKVISDTDERVLDTRPYHLCDDAQAEGSWETYMRRYALRTSFGLTGEDDDGAATVGSKQKGGSYQASAPHKASEKQIGMINSRLAKLAHLRGVSNDKATESLLNHQNVNGESIETLTKKQASDAIDLLIKWVDVAESKMEPELYSKDVEF